jgi:hypothetical protein
MGTISVTTKYRPIRTGLLVRSGSMDQLMRAVEINTLLWGGVRNPIIPVSEDVSDLEAYARTYHLDLLYPVDPEDEKLASLSDNVSWLQRPIGLHSKKILDRDNDSGRYKIQFLSIQNVIAAIWDQEYKHKAEDFSSNVVVCEWSKGDPLSPLLSTMLGRFPNEEDISKQLKADFAGGLFAETCMIPSDEPLDSEINNWVSPLQIGTHKLRKYEGPRFEDGIFVGESQSVDDLVSFWNLRATGIALSFYPVDSLERTASLSTAWMKKLDSRDQWHPNIKDSLVIHHRNQRAANLDAFAETIDLKKEIRYSDHGESVISHSRSAVFTFEWFRMSATVEQNEDSFSVLLGYPEKRFLAESRNSLHGKHMAVALAVRGEHEMPGHTLQLPEVPELNNALSRKVKFSPNVLRAKSDGMNLLIRCSDSDEKLHSIQHLDLVSAIFEVAGMKISISKPGLLLRRIVEKIGGLDACRVFKIAGVRKLLQEKTSTEAFTRNWATELIWDDGEFEKYEDLYIEQRDKEKLKTTDAFDYLVRKGLLHPGLDFVCTHCELHRWLSLDEVSQTWGCEYCGQENKSAPQLPTRGEWRYRKTGFFASESTQAGAVPTILTLMCLEQFGQWPSMIYCPSMEIDDPTCEVDFCMLQWRERSTLEVVIGECKASGQLIDENDIDNLLAVRDKFKSVSHCDCHLVLSRPTDSFEDSELAVFNKAVDTGATVIILGNRELEPYQAYMMDKDAVDPHVVTLEGMAKNSCHRYLDRDFSDVGLIW